MWNCLKRKETAGEWTEQVWTIWNKISYKAWGIKWAADRDKHDKGRQLLWKKGQIEKKKKNTSSKEKENENHLQDQTCTVSQNIERRKDNMKYDKTG